MIVSIASGKGGTGKTMVAASLMRMWGQPVLMADIDVEAPNLHLLIQPEIYSEYTVETYHPVVNPTLCTQCFACANLCQFGALLSTSGQLMVSPSLCHNCGGCVAICPEGAISYTPHAMGVVKKGKVGCLEYVGGYLSIGEKIAHPLVRAVRNEYMHIAAQEGADVIIDAPLGVSRKAVTSILDSDIVVLVTEPTPFGLYDMILAVQAFRPLKKTMAVVINQAGIGDEQSIYDFCNDQNLPVIASIPYNKKLAQECSQGKSFADASGEMHVLFGMMGDQIRSLANSGGSLYA